MTFFSARIFGIGFGTSIDMVREAGAIARPCGGL